jgi:hypothetical protein
MPPRCARQRPWPPFHARPPCLKARPMLHAASRTRQPLPWLPLRQRQLQPGSWPPSSAWLPNTPLRPMCRPLHKPLRGTAALQPSPPCSACISLLEARQ